MAAEDLEWERSKISSQDMNLLKKLGFTKKENALRFPKEESYPSPPMEYRLHQLTPNSILHVSIFITLCECFLGVQPNWALWKRIFCLRRNGSHGVAYNIGGVVICVRSDVDYFDVKFPDSVQGWRKRWLYVHEESSDSVEYNIAPFDGRAKILRRRSWDAEATEEEKSATEALMTRIHELQNTVARNCRNHPVLASLPPLPEGGEVEDRTVVDDDNQGTSRPESEVAGSHKSAASSEKDAESEATASTHSLPPAVSPRNKRKRDEVEDSGTSKAEEAGPSIRRQLSIHTPMPSSAQNLAEANKRADALAQKLEQSEKARKKAEADAKKAKADAEKAKADAEKAKADAAGRTHQEYEVDGPEGDELLDALTLLEIHGDEAREGLADAEAGLSKLFPYFFPKKEEPNTFVALAKASTYRKILGSNFAKRA
ncbi:hypothetical protein QYE76_030033 [Lolium multiflorum]|uniref:Transposase (putative) gypsy type domain-containing protein n=1 Tax=Lolium multiflorum TaxID=4521 RepID=A0AAD8QNY0_LOLMU|nr:hypothetical protein QYE76_030033 [Lolium multiflorum]